MSKLKPYAPKNKNYKLIYRTFLFRLFQNSTIVLVLPEDIDELTLHITSLINPIETKANGQLTNFLNNYKDTVYEKDNTCYLPQNQVIKVEKKLNGPVTTKQYPLKVDSLPNPIQNLNNIPMKQIKEDHPLRTIKEEKKVSKLKEIKNREYLLEYSTYLNEK